MSIVCALSNEVPEVPVVSPVSGAVFERRLIEKYIKEHGTDPINGEQLTEQQLVELKVPTLVKPKPPTFTSIPAILKSLQDEWDAVMLNSFTVRKQLLVARQELSHSLYQHDAACRVIARLNNELTAAREALATLKPQHDLNGEHNATPCENGEDISSPAFIEKLDTISNQLIADRKERRKTLTRQLASADQMREMKTLTDFPGLHPASGILSLDISPVDDNLLITGGLDSNAVVFDRASEKVVTILKGHDTKKKVSSVILHPNASTAITASNDTTVRVWDINSQSENKCKQVIRSHNGPVTAISLHPLNDYLLSASTDELWAFSDINTGKCLLKLGDTSRTHALTAAQLHPDGIIVGCGTSDSYIQIWNLRDKNNVATFPGHTGPINVLKFSENGYYLATAAEDGIRLWDLRKEKEFKTFEFDRNYKVNQVSFDYSGVYMAIAGDDIRVYETKKWENLRVFTDHKSVKDHTGARDEPVVVTDVKFGRNAEYLASTGMDRTLKIYGFEK